MCFGKGLSQNKADHYVYPYPYPNNFCGGFALNAVLADMMRGSSPMAVYMLIQEYQKHILDASPSETSRYLTSSRTNGTLMSLPSGICTAFKECTTGRIVTVYYTTNFGHDPFFGNLIGEERGRIEALGITVNPDSNLPKEGWTYVLILVNGRHWIAVKRVNVDKFVCYDPASGTATTAASMEAAIMEHSGITNIDGLYICIV